MKLSGWQGVWPKYQSVATLARSAEGSWGLETSLPMSFDSYGSFLVARTGGTDFPGYEVFGYANGALHSFGRFKPMGSSFEVDDENSEPVLQIGNKMFLNTEEGIYSFSIPEQGGFVPAAPLSSLDIVKRNNAALVLERFDEMPVNPPEPDPGSALVATQTYQAVESPAGSTCNPFLFANGSPVTLESREEKGKVRCVGTLKVARTTVITPRLPCAVEGLRRTAQFPWGYVYDPASAQHSIACPLDGDHENAFEFQIDVVLRE